MVTLKHKSIGLIILISAVVILVIVSLVSTVSLLHLSVGTNSDVVAKPVANRLVVVHINIPVKVSDFQLTLNVKEVNREKIKLDVTNDVTAIATSLEYDHLNQTQTVGPYQLRLISTAGTAAQIVITKL